MPYGAEDLKVVRGNGEFAELPATVKAVFYSGDGLPSRDAWFDFYHDPAAVFGGTDGVVERGEVAFVAKQFGVGGASDDNLASVWVYEGWVVVQHRYAVSGDANIHLDHIHAVFYGFFKACDGVLWGEAARAAVTNDFHATIVLLNCVIPSEVEESSRTHKEDLSTSLKMTRHRIKGGLIWQILT